VKTWGESTLNRAASLLRLSPGLVRPTTLSHQKERLSSLEFLP